MSVIDVSSNLGEYMLKGWVLTDEVCPNDNCPVPLLRSPKGHSPVTMLCANCNSEERRDRRTPRFNPTQSPSVLRPPSPSTVSSGTQISRSSTPPTEVSSGLSSPTFALPVETAESVRRRQQSDAASAEIGARLLKGWAMLADECPNPRCFGVPLVRPPLVGGKDPRKECVACGTVYIGERDAAGWDQPVTAEQQTSRSPSRDAAPSSGNAIASIAAEGSEEQPDARNTDPKELIKNAHAHSSTSTLQASALDVSRASLELALQSLSQRLISLAGHPAAVEPGTIGNTAEAMSKVLEALGQVGKLRDNNGA